jgi:hypothetical protein
MTKERTERWEARGRKVGSVPEFLSLSPEESAYLEM